MTAVRRAEPDPPGSATTTSPEALASYRDRLTRGEDAIDPDRWAGSLPAGGVAPRVRVGRSNWFNLLWLIPIGFLLLIVAVAATQGLRHIPAVARFIARYPGTVITASARAHPGLPIWIDVTHLASSGEPGGVRWTQPRPASHLPTVEHDRLEEAIASADAPMTSPAVLEPARSSRGRREASRESPRP